MSEKGFVEISVSDELYSHLSNIPKAEGLTVDQLLRKTNGR
jgi:hypothetical protein